jgi:hypothetical protein
LTREIPGQSADQQQRQPLSLFAAFPLRMGWGESYSRPASLSAINYRPTARLTDSEAYPKRLKTSEMKDDLYVDPRIEMFE